MNKEKVFLGVTLLLSTSFAILLLLQLLPEQIFLTGAEIFQLVIGLVAALIVLSHFNTSTSKYIILGTSLAIFSWTMGQLFWFSYTLLTGIELPYPSVGDLGYTGTYLLMLGVLRQISHEIKRGWIDYLPLFLVILPIPLYLLGQRSLPVLLYNILDCTVIAWILFQGLPIRKVPQYGWFLLGILILAFTDLVFIFCALLLPKASTLASAPLYPIAMALMAFGIIHGEEEDGT